MNNINISVCLATYNGETFIKEQLKSILQQIGNNDEVIVSDDGSTDKTISIIQSFNDDRITIMSGPQQGVIKNFEYLLKQARGNIIFLADQDDIWVSGKVATYLSELTQYQLVYSNVSIIDGNGNITKQFLYPTGINKSGFIKNFIKNSVIGATIAIRKEVLDKALPFPDNIEMHDTWLGFISIIFFSVKYLDTPYLYYRRHGNNLSAASEKSPNSFLTKMLIRLRYIQALISRILSVLIARNIFNFIGEQ